MTPDELGFASADTDPPAWRGTVGDRRIIFRAIRAVDELGPVELLQRRVFGVSDRDLIAASMLVVVPETGGEVIGAWDAADDGHRLSDDNAPLGFVIGWGGYRDHRPVLLSDMLAVRPDARRLGLAVALKRLQAAISWSRGFHRIVWTVDPLRAANARLNVTRLGATSHQYEINRYGDGYGAGLYGHMPTDRLHMDWNLTDPTIQARLRGDAPPPQNLEPQPPMWRPDLAPGITRALVPIPADIDSLTAHNASAALVWRRWLRGALVHAFASGWVITGFLPAPVTVSDPSVPTRDQPLAAYILSRF